MECFVMGVHQQEKGVAHQVAPLVSAADEIAGQAHPKAADIAVCQSFSVISCPEASNHEMS